MVISKTSGVSSLFIDQMNHDEWAILFLHWLLYCIWLVIVWNFTLIWWVSSCGKQVLFSKH